MAESLEAFDEAVTRLRELLRASSWPTELTWVSPSHLISFPAHAVIFRPGRGSDSEATARSAFEAAAAIYPAVRVGAIGNVRGATYAAVWPIREIGDGEQMFIDRGLKINVPVENPRLSIVRTKFTWWLAHRLYERWKRRRDAAFAT